MNKLKKLFKSSKKNDEEVKRNKNIQIITFMLCLKEKYNKSVFNIPKFVLIEIFKLFEYLFEDSSILIDEKHQNMLIKWIRETKNIPKETTKLLYRATRNGFKSRKFHRLCDNKLNTISIIKANNFIFGGFTSISWKQEGEYGEYKTDPKSFLFSISNPTNNPMKFKCINSEYAICCNNEYGPIFGQGHEIFISNNSQNYDGSNSNLGGSFEGCPFEYSSKEAKEFLCGSFEFQVQEIEVFQLF